MSDNQFENSVSDEVLDLARTEMKKNIAKKKRFLVRKKLYLRSFMTVVCLLVICVPLLIHFQSNTVSDEKYWGAQTANWISIQDLKSSSCASIQNINKCYTLKYHWWKEGIRQNTIQYTDKKQDLIMLKELYILDDITVYLYVVRNRTVIYDMELFTYRYDASTLFGTNQTIETFTDSNYTYYQFDVPYYHYFVQIDSIDSSITQPILTSIVKS